jgi:hypothetical protein
MKRLWISSINNNFDPTNDILMGPWCLLGNDQYLTDYKELNFVPDPLHTPSDLEHHEKMTSDFAYWYFNILAKSLNDINQSHYTHIFWHTMAFSWLIHLIQTTWEKQLRVNYLLKYYSNTEIEVTLVNNNIKFKFKNTLSFINNGLLNPIYHHWICSRLFEKHLPLKWKVNWINAEKINTIIRTRSIKSKILNLYSNLVPFSRISGTGKFESILWSIYLKKVKPRSLKQSYIQFNSKNVFNLNINYDWDELTSHTMPLYLRQIGNIDILKNGKEDRIYCIGPFPMYDEKLKLKTAKYLEQGSKVVLSQHGGHYGNAKTFSIAQQIEYCYSAFISWGWKKHENYTGNIIDLPSPFLSKMKRSKNIDNTAIYVSMGSKPMPIRFISNPQPLQQLKHLEERVSFFRNLNSDLLSYLLYRPYSEVKYFFPDPPNILNKEFPNLKQLTGNLHKHLKRCKLLILDHPGTTLNIAMSLNIPTICLWNAESWQMSSQSKPYFQSFSNSGIMCDTGLEAAQLFNKVWHNVEDWWNQPEIQKARLTWTCTYARTSKNWRTEWLNKFNNI